MAGEPDMHRLAQSRLAWHAMASAGHHLALQAEEVHFMERALALAAQAKAAGKAALSPALQLWSFALPYLLLAAGEVPVGAVLVHEGAVVAEACNQTEAQGDPTAHAEMLCIRQVHEHGYETAFDQSWVAESLEGVVEWAVEMQLLWMLACVS